MLTDLTTCVLALGGQATIAQLRERGFGDHLVAQAVRRRDLCRLTRGIYGVSEDPADPVALHRRRARAQLEVCSQDVVLSHHSALVVAGLPTYGIDLTTVTLGVRGDAGRAWRRAGVRVTPLPPRVVLCGRSVSVAAALAQVGVSSGSEAMLVAGDAALRTGNATRDDVADALSVLRGSNGIVAARAALPLLDGRRESPGESRLAWVLHMCRIPVEPQVTVRAGDRLYRTDFRVRGESVLIEFDGLVKYEDRGEIRRERRREADLIAAGWEVVRVMWPDLDDPVRVASLVAAGRRRAVARSKRRA